MPPQVQPEKPASAPKRTVTMKKPLAPAPEDPPSLGNRTSSLRIGQLVSAELGGEGPEAAAAAAKAAAEAAERAAAEGPAAGLVVPVRVVRRREGRGLDVALGGGLYGRAHLAELCDDWVQ